MSNVQLFLITPIQAPELGHAAEVLPIPVNLQGRTELVRKWAEKLSSSGLWPVAWSSTTDRLPFQPTLLR